MFYFWGELFIPITEFSTYLVWLGNTHLLILLNLVNIAIRFEFNISSLLLLIYQSGICRPEHRLKIVRYVTGYRNKNYSNIENIHSPQMNLHYKSCSNMLPHVSWTEKKSPKPGKKTNQNLSKWRAVQFRCVYFSIEKKVKYIIKVDCYFPNTEIWQKQKSYLLTREWKVPNFFLKTVLKENFVFYWTDSFILWKRLS